MDALCHEDGLTVIITTHYIEEARTAETVGLMRFGRLLVQNNPDELLEQHNLPTLEAVFLKLCQLDSAQVPETAKSDAMRYSGIDEMVVSTIETEKKNLKNMNSVEITKENTDINENIENKNGNTIKETANNNGIRNLPKNLNYFSLFRSLNKQLNNPKIFDSFLF